MLTEKLLMIIACFASIAFGQAPFEIRGVDLSIFQQTNNVAYRLPNTSHPESYNISLLSRIDQDDFTFHGRVRIVIVIDATTEEIVLHARQLTVTNIRLFRYISGIQSAEVPLQLHSYDNVVEFLRIPTYGVTLHSGEKFILEIDYNGVLRTDDGGFYRSSYIDSTGKKR